MCGIAGIISSGSPNNGLDSLGEKMLSTLEHRGPDSDGLWISPCKNVMLGHRRLAIQDLSPLGHQPMMSASQRYWIVFNGEIYNFRELAKELEAYGNTFSGHSDTEILLAAVDKWGLEIAVQKFIGMFAFAIWDVREQTLYLCRDRVGEKPLYYGVVGKNLYFASELKAIELVVNKSELNIDKTALNCFLRYGYINAPYSIYQGISKLPPGTILTISKNDVVNSSISSPSQYWNVYDVANNGLASQIVSEGEAVDELEKLLKCTIRRQLIADVNVGTFLSGGIDSTLVSAIAQKEAAHKIKTFTIGFHEKEYDESIYAKKIAKHIGSDHQEIIVSSKDALNVIPELPHIYDEPFADSSQIPTYLVSKIAKQQVTVCLSGDGGDELFAGYNRYIWLYTIWKRANLMPVSLRKLIGKLLSVPSPLVWDQMYYILIQASQKQNRYKLLGLKLQKLAGLFQQKDIRSGYDYLTSYWNCTSDLLTSEYQTDYTNRPASFPSMAGFVEEAMYWDQISYLPGDNLAKVDRASMRVSLETRLPLLSHEVLEFSWQLPLQLKVKEKKNKWALRKVLDRYVPNHLVDRPKMGFSVPIAKWLRSDLRVWAEDLLFQKKTYDMGIFNMEILEYVWREHLIGKYDHSQKIWAVLMFLAWHEYHANR